MHVLDTNTLSHLFAGHPGVLARRDRVPSSRIAITIVTQIEVLQGRYDFLLKAATGDELMRAQHWLEQTLESLACVETVLAVEPAAAAEFDQLLQIKGLKKIGRADILIASITLANRAILVTRNRKDFQKVPGLQVENGVD